MSDLIDSAFAMQQLLEDHAIPSAIIGGLAVSVWGRARLTKDVDLKLLSGREGADSLVEMLKLDYKPVQPDPVQALQQNGVLFVTDKLNVRLDLQLADTDFDRQIVERAVTIEFKPQRILKVCTAEDLIVLKLLSTRAVDNYDGENIVKFQEDVLDDNYIIWWLKQFEEALDDSTLISTYNQLRKRS